MGFGVTPDLHRLVITWSVLFQSLTTSGICALRQALAKQASSEPWCWGWQAAEECWARQGWVPSPGTSAWGMLYVLHHTGGRDRTSHPLLGHSSSILPAHGQQDPHARFSALFSLSPSLCPMRGQGRDNDRALSCTAWGTQAGRVVQALLGWHEGLV